MGPRTLGVDFDGILRIYPAPFRWWFDYISPHDVFVRAGLGRLKFSISKLFSTYIPIILDSKLIRFINSGWEGRKILISGRCLVEEKVIAKVIVNKYVMFDDVLFREQCSEPEEKYKARMVVGQGVEIFLEDRPFVREYLNRTTTARAIATPELWKTLAMGPSNQGSSSR